MNTASQSTPEAPQDGDWYGPDHATFGDRLAAAREQAGMTQGTLAKRLGVQLPTLRAWEDDMSEPRANRLSMLAGLLNVSIMWLINGEGEGVTDIENDTATVGDMAGVLSEIRQMRVDMLKKAEELGRLEKRMRKIMETASHG